MARWLNLAVIGLCYAFHGAQRVYFPVLTMAHNYDWVTAPSWPGDGTPSAEHGARIFRSRPWNIADRHGLHCYTRAGGETLCAEHGVYASRSFSLVAHTVQAFGTYESSRTLSVLASFGVHRTRVVMCSCMWCCCSWVTAPCARIYARQSDFFALMPICDFGVHCMCGPASD